MQGKFYPQSQKAIIALCKTLFVILISITGFNASAQIFCNNESVIFTENFGTGTTSSSSPDVTGVVYQAAGDLNDDFYRIINNTQQRPEWHNSLDHTVDNDGKMLVINGSAQTFYTNILTGPFLAANYATSLYLMNVNKPGTCAPNPLLPTLTFTAEYNTAATGGTWVPINSVTAASVPQSAVATWVRLGGVFALPFSAQRIRLTISDGTASGCGNDFAIDDIKFATCPEGGPTPVQFLSINAVQKGAGVSVKWATASELNSKDFSVEKSTDGISWTSFANVDAKGNSNSRVDYNSYDSKPSAGINYYRLRQTDIDGKVKYSPIAKVNITIDKIGVSVLANPFVNNITLDFLSNSRQLLSARLTDMAGRTVATNSWTVGNGTTRQVFSNVASLQKGMYILTIYNDGGVQLFNSKLVKQ